MNDLVERLRLLAQEVEPDFGGTLDEAADEIERLRNDKNQLRVALESIKNIAARPAVTQIAHEALRKEGWYEITPPPLETARHSRNMKKRNR